jgi:hypothetical protein
MPPEAEPGEQWRPVVGYEGIYDVSNFGRLWSRRFGGRLLNPSTDKKGYRRASLRKDGKGGWFGLHNLVLAAFIGPRPAGKEVTRHLDGNPDNNELSNLAYGTAADNYADRFEHGTAPHQLWTCCSNGHEYTPENTQWIGGRRQCRACRRRAWSAANARKSAERAASRTPPTHCSRGHSLDEPNVQPGKRKRGQRGCWACSRTNAYARDNGLTDPGKLQELSDHYYRRIVSGDTGYWIREKGEDLAPM